MRLYRNFSDAELMALMKSGNHLAFAEIYKRYWALLFRNARKMLHDDDEAGDLIQDIFTMLWDKASSLDINTSLSAYLYTSVRYKVFTLIKRSKLKTEHLNSLSDFLNQGVYSTDEWIQEKELAESIEAEMRFLPRKMREIFELSRKDQLSYQQIAEKLDITDHTVRKQISNALKILKTKISLFFSLIILLILS